MHIVSQAAKLCDCPQREAEASSRALHVQLESAQDSALEAQTELSGQVSQLQAELQQAGRRCEAAESRLAAADAARRKAEREHDQTFRSAITLGIRLWRTQHAGRVFVSQLHCPGMSSDWPWW